MESITKGSKEQLRLLAISKYFVVASFTLTHSFAREKVTVGWCRGIDTRDVEDDSLFLKDLMKYNEYIILWKWCEEQASAARGLPAHVVHPHATHTLPLKHNESIVHLPLGGEGAEKVIRGHLAAAAIPAKIKSTRWYRLVWLRT